MSSLLELKQVGMGFKLKGTKSPHPLFQDVSLEIERGQTLGIMGRSGAGKTTLGKIIAGLIRPTDGEVDFLQQNIHNLKPSEFRHFRSQVQMMFQDPEGTLNPKKNLGRILSDTRLITRLEPEDHDQLIRQTCAQVGLPLQLLDYLPWQLSGGINQRAALARILMLKPRLVVLDEPTSALDISIQAQILRLLKHIQEQTHISYVFISHDEQVVKWMSHRIGQLADHVFKITSGI